MTQSLRVTLLAATIGACLAGGGLAVHAADTAADATPTRSTYLITFAEPGVLDNHGSVSGVAATAPRNDGSLRFDARSPEVVAYRSVLAQSRQQHLQAIAARLGRSVTPTHEYEYTHSGIAAELTAAEAAEIARLPGVREVEIEPFYETGTYRGPTFIGADTIWNATPATPVNRGKGVVIGVLDSGIDADHPSFADDASCGFGGSDHKLLSYRDCSSTAAGVCNGPSPEVTLSSHGAHTASTAGGNFLLSSGPAPAPAPPAGFTSISGVAPCASIRSYKVCNESNGTCGGADIVAGINNAIADAVGVINFSISGGTSPWNDNDRTFLNAVNAGIFVAASAGNTSDGVPNPVGQVNHRGPWVMSVAASTHDQILAAQMSVEGPAPSDDMQGMVIIKGSTTPAGSAFTDLPLRTYAANIEGCSATGGIPAGHFNGAGAYIRRGNCPFAEKITNAVNAGAAFVLIGNNETGGISMNTAGAPTTVPAYSLGSPASDRLFAYVAANPSATTFSFTPNVGNPDMLGDFSLRGPTSGVTIGVTKPDITAPGVSIYAAVNGGYGRMSGTSMSSPHVAGAAALIRAVHPDWNPVEVKSALQMTAKRTGRKDDGATPWDPDDVGNGRVDLTVAAKAGLVMNETYANYLAANPSTGGDPKTLNLPSMRNMACAPSCTFTRTVSSKLAASATWNASFEGAEGLSVTVSPASFTLAPGASQTLTITVAPEDYGPSFANRIGFGFVVLKTATSGQAPDATISLAVRGAANGIYRDGFDPAP